MILASLIDAGLSFSYLKYQLKKLKLKGYELKSRTVTKQGFRASRFEVIMKDRKSSRSINDIYPIINKSSLKKSIKDLSRNIFKKLCEAESHVHTGMKGHLHEAGAVDAIIDIVGAAIGLDKLGISEVYSSPLPSGYGAIKSAHGTLPNPAPATAELLKGVPIYKKDIRGELVTPTGAAIIATVAKSFSDMPMFELKRTGLGAGTFDLSEPNILRLFIGEASQRYESDLILHIETNIDNMNPEFYDHAIKRIMKAGALDAYITPVRMKKNRPGVTLTALSPLAKREAVMKAIFTETTTLGVRTYLVKRQKLERAIRMVKTRYGKVPVKVGRMGGNVKNISPEYEDCVRLSKKTGVPLKSIYDETKSQALKDIRAGR